MSERGSAEGFWRPFRQPAAALYRLLLLGLALWVGWRSLGAIWAFTIDDAGISYAYAKHIAAGQGPVAAPGGPWVEGYSNALWVFLLVPFAWLGLPLPVLAKWLGVALFAGALAAGAGLLGLERERRWRSFGALEAALAIAMVACVELAVWVVAGLESSLFVLLTLLLAFLDARESRSPTRIGASGLAAFALCITRPEGALYAAPLLAIKLVQALRKREPWRQAITAGALCLAPLLVYHALHYLVFRELVPNTYYAKPGSPDASRGYDYLTSHLQGSGLVYALPLAGLGLIGKLRLKLMLAWSCLAGALFILYAGGDWMPHGRFLSLFAPALLVLAACGVSNLARLALWLSRGRLPRELALLCLSGGLLASWWTYHEPRLRKVARRPWCHFCERVADTQAIQRLSSRAGLPSYSLVTHDFGGPAWLSDERLYPLDFLGLCDPSIAQIRAHRARVGRASGLMGNDFRFYQYVIHEQPSAPSWLYIPPNFWARFQLSPEYQGDYFRLAPRLLKNARRDAIFGLHRGELLDYFPPLPGAEPRRLTPRLTLVGSAIYLEQAGASAQAAAGVELHARLSLVTRGSSPRLEQLKLRVESGPEVVESAAVPLARGLKAVARQLRDGEPLSVDLSVTLPASATPYQVSLAVSRPTLGSTAQASTSEAGWELSALGSVLPGATLPPPVRLLPRYPAALPAPIEPELRALRGPVSQSIEKRRQLGHEAANDRLLAQRLSELGERLEATGRASQAYLAYVWATQVDRRTWRELAEPVFRLRQPALDDAHTTELMLLRHYYASGSLPTLARLVTFYLAAARPLEASYFMQRLPAPIPAAEQARWSLLTARLEEQLAASDPAGPEQAQGILGTLARDPLGDALDFEAAPLSAWSGDERAFSAGSLAAAVPGLRGHHGEGVLSSLRGGKKARGTLLSKEFRLDGSHLSLLIGGGARKRKVGVELIVDGQAVKAAYGNDSNFMYPELWDLAEHAGKTARLRVFDRSARSYVLLDRVLLWR